MTKELKKNTLIVSAFPGCGKTYLYENQESLNFEVHDGTYKTFSFLDSDSSRFSKAEGWEKNYVDYLESKIGSVDFLFISQHEGVLKEFNSRKIPFVVVVPNNMTWESKHKRSSIKQQWFGRFVLRDNSHIKDFDSWMKLLKENYDKWTSLEHITKYNPTEYFILNEGEYMTDIINMLIDRKELHSGMYCFSRSCSRKLINPDYEASNDDPDVYDNKPSHVSIDVDLKKQSDM